ncbi:MAG: S8 family serine peptidase [Flavobacteriales bacterium]|nr:S8 family serine peptidase [Flavobacteriales bacterium]
MKHLIVLFLCTLVLNVVIAQEKPQTVPGNIIVQIPSKAVDKVINANQFFEGQPTNLKLNRLLSAPMAAYLLEFNPNIHHNRFLQQLWNHPSVTLVQLNHYIQQRAVTPNDPQLGQQWWHVNNGGGGGTADADIDSDEAWEITTGGVTATGDTIVVCVVDDGGDLDHPDLIANNWVNRHEIPNNNIDDDNNGYIDDYLGWNPVNDDDDVDGGSHGVNVAGMIGALGNNGVGVVGVNWNVKIMNMTYGSIGSVNNPNEANVIEAYTYPLVMRRLYEQTSGAKGAYVVATNSSWGLDGADPLDAPLWCAFYDTLGLSGILSAGSTANNNVNIDVVGDLPTGCSSEYLLSITATDNSDVRTFSGYGQSTVDLGAPGEDVRTTAPGGGYTTTSGTSFAGPATAGAVALVYSAPCASLAAISHSDPALAARMVRDAIFNGVDPVANLATECVTGGRLNLKGALDEILNTCESGGCLRPFSVVVTSTIDIQAEIDWSALASIDSFNISYGEVGGAANLVSELTETEYLITGLSACLDYWFVAQSICDGETSDWTDTLFFSTDGCCVAPDLLELSDETEDGVTATWNSVFAADNYTLQWRPIGGGDWTQEAGISATTFAISGLESCTEYEVQVATNCDGLITDFTDVESFQTFGCGSCTDQTFCASAGSNDFEWINNVTVGNLNNTSDDEVGGYTDFSAMSVDLQRGETYYVSFSPDFSGQSYTEHFRLWIDLNQNGSFANAEMLFDDVQGSNNTVSGTITIPLTAQLGSARMRVSMAYGGQFGDYPQGACDEGQDGEVEDYCVNIIEEDSSGIDGIGELNGIFGMEVFPVPTADLLNIRMLENNKNESNILLIDASGRVVSSMVANGQTTQQLDVSNLAQGVYVIELLDRQRSIVGRARFVKQ